MVGVLVGVAVAVAVLVGVAVLVDSGVAEGVLVGVAVLVALPALSITSCAAVAPVSRLATLAAVLLPVVKAKFHEPLSVTKDDTSTEVQTPEANAPEEPSTAPVGGALL